MSVKVALLLAVTIGAGVLFAVPAEKREVTAETLDAYATDEFDIAATFLESRPLLNADDLDKVAAQLERVGPGWIDKQTQAPDDCGDVRARDGEGNWDAACQATRSAGQHAACRSAPPRVGMRSLARRSASARRRTAVGFRGGQRRRGARAGRSYARVRQHRRRVWTRLGRIPPRGRTGLTCSAHRVRKG